MKQAILFASMFIAGVSAAGYVIADDNAPLADTNVAVSESAPAEADPATVRFRLREEVTPANAPDIHTSEDFDWGKLSENGPKAAGKNPTIGKGSGKTYYSFPDGQAQATLIHDGK